MKWIKLGLISTVLLFALLMFLAAFIPSKIRISRAIDINSPVNTITPFVSDLRKWSEWNIMVADSMIGKAVKTNRSINAEKVRVEQLTGAADSVRFIWKQGKREVTGGLNLIPAKDITIVQFYYDFKLNWYPWEKFASITFDQQMGPVMEKSLGNLKNISEKNH